MLKTLGTPPIFDDDENGSLAVLIQHAVSLETPRGGSLLVDEIVLGRHAHLERTIFDAGGVRVRDHGAYADVAV